MVVFLRNDAVITVNNHMHYCLTSRKERKAIDFGYAGVQLI